MTTYQDKWTRWHHKAVIDGKPSSGNGWYYTALAKHLGFTYSDIETVECFIRCSYRDGWTRNPNQIYPPLSMDELIGMSELGLVSATDLSVRHWNFCALPEYKKEPLTIKNTIRSIAAAFKIRKEHRNYFWENKITDVYHLAFRVMPWHRYFFKKKSRLRPNLWETSLFYLHILSTLLFSPKYVKLKTWVQLKGLNHPAHKLFNWKDYIVHDFEPNHPFRNKE